jgi:hypothetical protein
MPGLAQTVILLFVLPCVAGVTDMHHHPQSLVEMRSLEPGFASTHDPEVTGIIGISHHTQPVSLLLLLPLSPVLCSQSSVRFFNTTQAESVLYNRTLCNDGNVLCLHSPVWWPLHTNY